MLPHTYAVIAEGRGRSLDEAGLRIVIEGALDDMRSDVFNRRVQDPNEIHHVLGNDGQKFIIAIDDGDPSPPA